MEASDRQVRSSSSFATVGRLSVPSIGSPRADVGLASACRLSLPLPIDAGLLHLDNRLVESPEQTSEFESIPSRPLAEKCFDAVLAAELNGEHGASTFLGQADASVAGIRAPQDEAPRWSARGRTAAGMW